MPVSDDDPRFHTLCCHVRTCTIVIAVLDVLGVIGVLISAIQGTIVTQGHYYYIIAVIAVIVAWCIVVSLLIYGVLKESPTCIIPHIIMQILAIIGAIIIGIVLIVLGALAFLAVSSKGEHSHANEETDKQRTGWIVMGATFLIVTGVIVLIYGLVQIYFVHVVIQFYRYLKEKVG